jgi:hemolysin activation/secretion protein
VDGGRNRRGTRPVWRLIGALALSLLASAAVAQQAPRPALGPLLQPGQGRPIPELPATPNFDFSIEAPRRSPVPRAVEELSFEVKDIRIAGSTVYSPEQLRPLYEPLIGHSVHLADILAVADQIEGKYRADGYILTRAFVPPQSVSNGVFQINVVEGYIEAVSVEGGDEDARNRVRAIVAPVTASRPLQLKVIESALLRANQLPGTGASGLLRPSPTQPGASDLAVTVTAEPVSVVLSMDNRGTKLTSRWTQEADVAALVGDDQIVLTVQKAPHWDDRHAFSGKYSHPIGTDGLTVSGNFLASDSSPSGPGAGGLQLPTKSRSIGGRAAYPLVVSRDNLLALDGGLTIQKSEVNESGGGSTTDLRDDWRTIDIAVAYQNVGFLGGVSSVSFDVAHGLSILGASSEHNANATRAGGQPDFTKFSTIIRRTQPLWDNFSAAFTGIGQYSLNTLMLGEEVSYGGAVGVGRGYDPASLTGDSGAGGAFELRYDDASPVPYVNNAQYYVFYDAARIWNHKAAPPNNDTLQSTGIGVRLSVVHNIALGIEVAHTFVPLPTNDLHGDGQGNNVYTRDTRALFNGSIKF